MMLYNSLSLSLPFSLFPHVGPPFAFSPTRYRFICCVDFVVKQVKPRKKQSPLNRWWRTQNATLGWSRHRTKSNAAIIRPPPCAPPRPRFRTKDIHRPSPISAVVILGAAAQTSKSQPWTWRVAGPRWERPGVQR